MKKAHWQKRIVKACKAAGTYKPFFDSAIDTLSGLMEARDEAEAQYKLLGSKPVITHTNKNHEDNIVKNPAIVVIMDLNAQALNYWRELGLTSKSWQAMMKEEISSGGKNDSLSEALSKIGV